MNFVRFVLQAKNDNTPLGDVARDILMDVRVKPTWSYKRLLKHLDECRACELVYGILEDAKEAFVYL